MAISYRASVEIIRSLLEVFPESAGLANGVGAYPLHLMCDYGSSVESLRAILETPEGAATVSRRMGQSSTALDILNVRRNFPPFRRALMSMREARKRQQTIRNEMQRRQGQLQQENGLRRHLPDQNVLEAGEHGDESNARDPTSDSNVDNSNNNSNGDDGSARGRGTLTSSEQTNAMLQRLERMIASFQQNDYWQKAAMLILVEYTRQPLSLEGLHDEQTNIVHACAGVSSCNPFLLEFALLLHQDDLIQKKDSNGRLPLHVAAINHAASLLGNDSASQRLTQGMLLQILEACSKAAFVQDKNDKLPLAVALQELGRPTTKACGDKTKKVWSPGLQRLLDANLAALETLNLDERFYPLILKRMTSPNELFLCLRRHPHLFQNR